jgi:hypothetical protein
MKTYTFNVTNPVRTIVIEAKDFTEARAKLREQLAAE